MLPSGTALIALIALAPLAMLVFSPGIVEHGRLDESTLHDISPFLTSGHIQGDAGAGHYVGRVAETWAYLGTEERRQVGADIGREFEALGAAEVTLVDPLGLIVMRYADGAITMLAPRIETRDD
jgi:hypothetical protein